MVRVKFASVLIGTTGVGLMASLTAMQSLVGTFFGLGIGSSAVREVATAVAKQDDQAVGRAVLTLRRVSWLTGLAGMSALMLSSPTLSQLTFGSDAHIYDISALGLVILFGNLSAGQMALIQGMRLIGDMARANLVGAVLATATAIGFYTWLGLRGIVPALVCIAAMQLAVSWFYARRVPVPSVTLTWRQTLHEAGGMVRLGLVFMWNGLMGSAVSYITITLITKEVGLQGVGIYSAAFALSGMFVGFVLGAMGADYYPRLTAVAHDKAAMNSLVNEQTEIGLLLAVPGLLATVALAPWIIQLFYTIEFLPAVELLQWFVLGCLGRVISWPMGFVMIALNRSTTYLFCEILWNVLHVFLIAIGIAAFGLKGVSVAFSLLYIVVTIQAMLIAKKLTGFVWSKSAFTLVLSSIVILAASFVSVQLASVVIGSVVSLVLTLAATIYAIRGIFARVDLNNKFIKKLFLLPGFSFISGIRR
jgi:PST family polysaccharide transporter